VKALSLGLRANANIREVIATYVLFKRCSPGTTRRPRFHRAVGWRSADSAWPPL